MVADGKAMAFVADELNQVEDRRAAVEDDGLVFVAVEIDDFFLLGDGGQGLRGEAERFQSFGRGVQLAEAAVDEDKRWHRLVFFFESAVASRDDFAHGGEVVDAEDGHDLEFAVGGLVHLAVFPHDHGGDCLRALNVGDVEALDATRQFGKHQDVGKGFLDGFARGLEDAEALDVGLLGVLTGEVDERAFFSALRNRDFDAAADAFGEQGGEGIAIVEVDRDEDGARDVVLIDVELLEQGGEDVSCVEDGRFSAFGFPGLRLEILRQAQDGLWGTRHLWHGHVSQIYEFREIFPEELAAIDDFAAAHVEEVDGQAAVFEVISEDVCVVALLGGGDALLLLQLVHGGELVAQARGGFKLLGLGGGNHARGQRALEFALPAFEKKLGVADSLLVGLRRG